MKSKFFLNNFFHYLPILLLFNLNILPVKGSSALAAWVLKSNGVLELRSKSNTKLKAYFQKGGFNFGDRFWIDFPGELKTPRTLEGNGPVKEIRLGKPFKGKTRLVIEFADNSNLKPLNWRLVGVDQNRWKIKLFSSPKNSFQTIGEGLVSQSNIDLKDNKKAISSRKKNYEFSQLPDIERNKFYVVIDPGHGGPDPGAIGIGGLKESEIVLDISKRVQNLLSEKGVKVRLTRNRQVDLDLSTRVSIANRTYADIFVSIHANASRGKRRDINGLETFYYTGWRGRLLAKKIQKQILKASPGSPDRGVRQARYYVIKNTKMPAALVEIGFLTGRLDARKLEKSIHRKRIAYAITRGILQYLSKAG